MAGTSPAMTKNQKPGAGAGLWLLLSLGVALLDAPLANRTASKIANALPTRAEP